jgi:hypothetical protein
MKRIVGTIVLGLAGFAAAIGLTVGALALAGDDVGTVVQPNLGVSRSPARSGSPSDTPSPSRDDRASVTPSPSADDHGEDLGSDDNSGPGSDNSGPGSDNSGPGSDSSGSGSSGSGSDDD